MGEPGFDVIPLFHFYAGGSGIGHLTQHQLKFHHKNRCNSLRYLDKSSLV